MAWQFWIDRGGTFTDIVARAPGGQLVQQKLLSENPERYADAAIAGIRLILGLADDAAIPPGLVEAVKMGTTVGTNALLTRTGEATLLVATAGFADLPRIGDQSRPDIFALAIVKPEPLHAAVVEADERIGADGTVLRPLDEAALERALAEAYRNGLRACAIAFMHAWKNPAHEIAAGAVARRVGFPQVSLSHRVSPLIKYLPRLDTAVLDAYLSPPLRRYVDRVAAALPADCRLEFMQSNGGLVAADAFQGKDSVLSGPAGGLVGMAKVGQAAGATRLIGFDMGGTSTDVSLYSGELERQAEAEVAGCRVRVPMLAVHTVAAGGGSILHFDAGRLTVGPDSAGSVPGPCAYRRGGPLAVTDANLYLGRIQAGHFPAVFGPAGDQPLDANGVARAFAALTERVNRELDLDYSPERLAEGFLAIAVENMADAVRHITLERGVNPADFTLVCFGGAGGQLACRVAASLGLTRILVSPFAAVLSAYGIGLAERRAVRQVALETPLAETRLPAPEPGARERVLLRYDGSDTTLAVARAEPAAMAAAFHGLHGQRFGFADPARALICTALEIEHVSGGGDAAGQVVAAAAQAAGSARMHLDGAWREVPLYRRDGLAAGQRVAGPALVVEAGSCTVVDPGWQLEMTGRGDLLLSSAAGLHRLPDLARPDPTWLTLFNRRFMSIAEDMGRVLQMTARSVNIRERLDFSCALFDRRGDLIANAPHIPVHLGSMGDSVKAILTRFPDLAAGDACLINSPYHGGTHLPDITVVRPVFAPDGGELRYFTAARAHHADIGGIAPGSMPAASTRIDQEGCLSDGLRIVAGGRFQEAAVRAWLASATPAARNPDQNVADLQAQLAACAQGEALLRRLEDEVGAGAVLRYMAYVQDNAEAAVVRLLGRLKDGRFDLPLDGGGVISAAVRIAGARAGIDFTASSGADPGNLNAPAAIVRSAVLYVFRTLLDVDIPLNAGVLRPLDVRLAPGSLLDPRPPAAVVAGNVETSQNIVDALYGALGVLAASQGTMNNFSFGDGTRQYYETVCGGTGAGHGHAGAAAVHSHMTNSRLTDPEVLEAKFPVRIERFAIRRGSGGDGRWPGGDGVERRLRFLAAMHGNLIALRRAVAPFGLAGGGPGQPGRQWLEHADGSRTELPERADFQLAPGDLFVLQTPGGGGYGDV
ncbi:5-oxoprolinase [Parasulfuritortus cantonensis]|uniref:5-oxoprolinase n=1 Tax=Parasulfuritortus cantonensis TaxID=2528202 RepID=A0A4R1B5C9_9PROT|nr:hydantoinase B/oxoprolinase family protein [Parasulfuritortus cantonensis]TCJ13181.1 5-oxoprolinase [Parasulfuritortus cantonensis]